MVTVLTADCDHESQSSYQHRHHQHTPIRRHRMVFNAS